MTSLDYGLQTFAIFAGTLIISLAVVLVFNKKKSSERIVIPKKVRIINLLFLCAFVFIVITIPQLASDAKDLLGQISQTVVDQGPLEVGLYAGILGVVPAILFLWILGRSRDLTSRFVFDQKIVLEVTIILFVMELMVFAIAPLLSFITTATAFLAHNNLENLKLHVLALLNVSDLIVEHLTVAPILLAFLDWIPIVFLIFVIFEIRSSHLSGRMKVVMSFLGIIPLIIVQAPRELTLLFPVATGQLNYLSIFVGPITSTLLMSFLATGGYVHTIRGNIKKFNTNSVVLESHLTTPRFQNLNIKIFAIRSVAALFLIINIIGLCRNLFLVIIPFSAYGFPIGMSLINGIFINSVSSYVINTIGQGYHGATLVYNSFTIFFSLFWLYDIVMTFKGFREEYLDSENTVYRTIRRIIGPLAATAFLSLLVLFIVNSIITDLKATQLNTLMPNWVQNELNLQNNTSADLSRFASYIDFASGLATVAGVIYLVIRSRKLVSKKVART